MTADFAIRLLDWFDQHGRHDLPWQVSDDPYKVWVSEIMLQQTQVKTVLQYFERFIQRFPTVESLAAATWDEVAPYWAGLGYYARARNLHKAAQDVAAVGHFPQTLDGWMALSGIGQSTAGALMSLGLRQYGVIMDGNVKRVLTRYFAIEGDSAQPQVIKQLWSLAEQLTPAERNADYTQAIMDLGATLCTPKKPLCLYCPMQADCQAYAQNRVLEFPQKTPKKPNPTRHAQVLFLQVGSQYLWVQRPDQGLWGGLWCLPILEDLEQLPQLQQQFGGDWQLGKQIKHSFTHFHWQLQAVHVELDQSTALQVLAALNMQELAQQWLNATQAKQAGIPQAMMKLLGASETLATCHETNQY
ncbi:MAG: A/G-specific adenine glycosylase [Pseudomonadota bacterium]|nr:A/G-specific adenine glycosylase [Pseudomonadota bacterium]